MGCVKYRLLTTGVSSAASERERGGRSDWSAPPTHLHSSRRRVWACIKEKPQKECFHFRDYLLFQTPSTIKTNSFISLRLLRLIKPRPLAYEGCFLCVATEGRCEVGNKQPSFLRSPDVKPILVYFCHPGLCPLRSSLG